MLGRLLSRHISGNAIRAVLLAALWTGISGAIAQTGLTLKGDTVTGQNGQTVEVVFRTEGFWEITQGMGTIQWDPSVMDYDDASRFGIPELNGGSFSRIPEGMLIFNWSSDNALGNTLADGTVLFALSFSIRGGPGDSTTVAFNDAWLALHFESAESIDLPFSSVPATVSVVPEPASGVLLLAGVLALLARRQSGGCRTT